MAPTYSKAICSGVSSSYTNSYDNYLDSIKMRIRDLAQEFFYAYTSDIDYAAGVDKTAFCKYFNLKYDQPQDLEQSYQSKNNLFSLLEFKLYQLFSEFSSKLEYNANLYFNVFSNKIIELPHHHISFLELDKKIMNIFTMNLPDHFQLSSDIRSVKERINLLYLIGHEPQIKKYIPKGVINCILNMANANVTAVKQSEIERLSLLIQNKVNKIKNDLINYVSLNHNNSLFSSIGYALQNTRCKFANPVHAVFKNKFLNYRQMDFTPHNIEEFFNLLQTEISKQPKKYFDGDGILKVNSEGRFFSMLNDFKILKELIFKLNKIETTHEQIEIPEIFNKAINKIDTFDNNPSLR